MAGGATPWDDVADTYESESEPTTGFSVDRYLDHIAPTAGQRIADVACGPGVLTLAFAQRGAHVCSLDFSAPMVERLRQRADEAGLASLVEGFVGDAAALPFDDDECDAAASNFGVIFCPDIDGALREMARVTKPGGALMMSAWTHEARNGWTSLLPRDFEAALGFTLPPRPMYRWASDEELRVACARAGWSDVTIEVVHGPPSVLASTDAGHALDSPATIAALARLSDAQWATLREYVVGRAREVFGDGEVRLPREAWLVRGRAT